MNTSKKYKRYMVFCWTLFDNSEPFDCIEYQSDVLLDALEFIDNYELSETDAICVFDRVEGVVSAERQGDFYNQSTD